MRRTCFGGGYGPVVRQNTEWNDLCSLWGTKWAFIPDIMQTNLRRRSTKTVRTASFIT
jgi:hypothetical protein